MRMDLHYHECHLCFLSFLITAGAFLTTYFGVCVAFTNYVNPLSVIRIYVFAKEQLMIAQLLLFHEHAPPGMEPNVRRAVLWSIRTYIKGQVLHA